MNTDNYVRFGQYVYVRRYDSAGSLYYLYCDQPPTPTAPRLLQAATTAAHTKWQIRSTASGSDPRQGNIVVNRDIIYLSPAEESASLASLYVGQTVVLGQGSAQEV